MTSSPPSGPGARPGVAESDATEPADAAHPAAANERSRWWHWRPDRVTVAGVLAGAAVYLLVIGLGQFALAVLAAALIVLVLSLVRTTRQVRVARERARRRALDGDL